MRIDAEALVADTFRYETARAGGRSNRIALGRSGGVTGFYELEAGRHAVDAASALLEVTEALWQIGPGEVALRQPSRLDGVRFALAIPPGAAATTMHLDVKAAALAGVEYGAGELAVTGGVTVEGLVVERAADGTLTIAAETLVARDVLVTRPTSKITLSEVRVEELRVEAGRGSARAEAEHVRLAGGALTSASTSVEVDGVEARGVSFAGQHLRVAELGVASAKVAHALAPRARATESASVDEPRAMPDLPLLDRLDGNLDVDVEVTAMLSVLEKRSVHHPVRIPIQAGAISFAELEHGLSLLEDAVLDFEVQNDQLVLELDVIPLLRFDNVTLVSWPFADPTDRELAKHGRIRLRRLLQYRLPTPRPRKEPERATKKRVRLLRLDLARIVVSLALGGPADTAVAGGRVRLGDAGRPGVEALTVGGELHAVLEGDAVPGHLDLAASGIHAALDGLAFGGVRLAHAGVDVAALEPVRVELSNLSPLRVSSALREAHVRGLELDVGIAGGRQVA